MFICGEEVVKLKKLIMKAKDEQQKLSAQSERIEKIVIGKNEKPKSAYALFR
jgi:hypothetical protein